MNHERIFGNIGKTVGLFGLGRSNIDILTHLPRGTRVILRTEKRIPALPSTEAEIVGCFEGPAAFDSPCEDILIFSPSVRRERAELLPFKRRGVRFSSDCELFFERSEVPVFAASGSDGKSTVTTLTSLLLSEKFGHCPAVGNIGVPMLSSLLSDSSAYAVELSSFMLRYGRCRVLRGAITNINENHLNWHKDFSEYSGTKLSLLKSSSEAIISYDDRICREYLEENSAYGAFSFKLSCKELKRRHPLQVIYTYEDSCIRRNGESILSIEQIKHKDENHLKNLMCALALTDGYVSRKRIAEVARSFSGLSHRAEHFYSHGGFDFIDSSVDTTPSRTAATLDSLKRRVVLILGGQGKGLTYEPILQPIKKYAAAVIITGENRKELADTLRSFPAVYFANGQREAVELASGLLSSGDALLLSPASASFDAFKSYEQRGDEFKKIVKDIFK